MCGKTKCNRFYTERKGVWHSGGIHPKLLKGMMMIFRWTWGATRPCTWRPGRVTPPPPPPCSASGPRSTWRSEKISFLTFDFHLDQKLRMLMDLCISCNLENLFLSEIQIGWWISAEIIDRFIAWLDYFCELNMNNIQIHEMISAYHFHPLLNWYPGLFAP